MKLNFVFRPLLLCMILAVSSVHAQTLKTLNYLQSISGSKTLSGQHNKEPNSNPSQYTDQIVSTTGKYPALWSGDFLFSSTDISNRQTMINMAKTQWNAGAAINLMFHACPPTTGEPCAWDGGVVSHLSDAQWNELITNGTTLNNNWKARLDIIAGYLQDLKNNGVEVLFRPFHEMNQGVFWWAGRTGANGTVKLFQITHDYLKNTKGLTNLIWVWDLQDFGTLSSDLNNYDPGSSYWDVLAMDMYSSDGQGYTSTKYNAMINKAGTKPIAIGECDQLPTSSLLTTQPRWTFFMGWAELTFSTNTTSAIQSVHGASNVLTRDEMPGWASGSGINVAYNRPVTVSSTENSTNIGSKAVDANGTTRWSSLYSDTQWIYVDLGITYNINRVKITWETAYGKNYYLETSPDGSTWTNLKTVSNNTSLINDHTGLSRSARYVRIYCTARGTAYGYSIFEFEVYGTAGGRMISDETEITDNTLLSTYPNPVHGEATIRINLPTAGDVDLSLFDSMGNKTVHVKEGNLEAGHHEFRVDTKNFSTGLYHCVLHYNGQRIVKKILTLD
jgi:mannan endo-1,4-beta-mannosidase